MNPRISLWMGEITTILGSSAFLGAGVGILTHAVAWPVGVATMAGAAVMAIMPQNHTAPSVAAQDVTDLLRLGASLGRGSQSVSAVAAQLPLLASDLQATFALMGAAHAATPPGGSTVSRVADGAATVTTTLPLPGGAVASVTTSAAGPAGGPVATETASSAPPAPTPAPAAVAPAPAA